MAYFMKKTPWPGTCCLTCGMRPIRGTLHQSLLEKKQQFCDDCVISGSEQLCVLRLAKKPLNADDPEIAAAVKAAKLATAKELSGWKFLLKTFGPTIVERRVEKIQRETLPVLALFGASLPVLPSPPPRKKFK